LEEKSTDPNELMRLKAEVTQLRASLAAMSQHASLGLLLPAFLHEASHTLHHLNALASALLGIGARENSQARQRIEEGMVAALRRFGELLDSTRLLAEQHRSTRVKSSDLRVIIEEAVAIALDVQDVETTVTWDSAHCILHVNHGAILGALVNVLMNAREAIRDTRRHGIISIEARDVVRHFGQALEIVITDNGIGIPESDIIHVFLPGFSTRPNRTGLGLTIVKAAIEDHGGSVAIASEGGDGAAVVIRLPIYRIRDKSH
jgi:signal transduction histidine kinase